jgi:hypothetical protein
VEPRTPAETKADVDPITLLLTALLTPATVVTEDVAFGIGPEDEPTASLCPPARTHATVACVRHCR